MQTPVHLADRQRLVFDLPPQPSQTSCGPTCLHGIYRYYGDKLSLQDLIKEVPELEDGGTLAVFLGQHALARGYKATLYSFNLEVFDPTWYSLDRGQLMSKLKARSNAVRTRKLKLAINAYHEFLNLGGELKFADLNSSLLRKYLKQGVPILTGLSSTFLYRACREIPQTCQDDDIAGEPAGHFIVITGYHQDTREAFITDPYLDNPLKNQHYCVSFDRLINSILLGTYTYDANLLIIPPPA